jgi:excisionase family DNA binding protein
MPITLHTKIEELPQFLTVEEWRTFMRIGRSSAYDLIRQGILPVIRWGRTVRISREAVMGFIVGMRPRRARVCASTLALTNKT